MLVIRTRIRRFRMLLGLPYPHPDPLDKGTNPRIRIRTKMSLVHNTAKNVCSKTVGNENTKSIYLTLSSWRQVI